MSNEYSDTHVPLIINKLSKEKYDELEQNNLISENEIYLVDEDNLDAASGVISNVGTPVSPTDAANKQYVDDSIPDNIVINNADNSMSQIAIGTCSQATACGSIAAGIYAQAIGNNSIATGYCAQATKEGSIATGSGANAEGFHSIATGNSVSATGDSSIAIGYNAQAADAWSIATGSHAYAKNNFSIATGAFAQATKEGSIAAGSHAQATREGSIATGTYAQAIAKNTIAIGAYCHAASGDVTATANTPIVIGSNASEVAAAQIRVTKDGVMTVGGKEVGKFETKTFTTDSQTGETDRMIIAKQENGVQPRLHAGDKDIHGVTGFSNESDKYTGQRYILDWDLAMSNDTSYLMGATKWTGSRRIGANNDAYTTTFVQPLIPANTGTTNSVLPYALPCFENSPVYWNGHIIWNNSLCAGEYTAQAKDITIPWDNVGSDVSSIEFVVNNNKTYPAYRRRSLAIGYCAKADLCHSVAIGPLTEATGCNAIATGNNAKATGDSSIATGYNAQATNSDAIATGPYAQATGDGSIATGRWAQATNCHSIATGYDSMATGGGSIAIGDNAQATGDGSIATGRWAQATGSCSIATGFYAKAQDDYTIAIGASKGYDYSVSASTAVPIVIGSDASAVSAAQIKVTNTGIMTVGGNPVAMQDDIPTIPTNYVTTNTEQTISKTKTFNEDVIVKGTGYTYIDTLVKEPTSFSTISGLELNTEYETTFNWLVCEYHNGVWVASTTTYVYYSEDGKTWQKIDLTITDDGWPIGFTRIRYENNVWVAITNTAGKGIYYSDDGKTWSRGTWSTESEYKTGWLANSNYYDIAYGNGKWLAVDLSTSNYLLAYSTDGKTWFGKNLSNKTFKTICYNDGKWIASTSNNTIYMSTDNGDTWQSQGKINAAGGAILTQHINNMFLHYTLSHICYSADGKNWKIAETYYNTDSTTLSTLNFSGVTTTLYANNVWLVYLQAYSAMLYSTDNCKTWHAVAGDVVENITGICYANNTWFATRGYDNDTLEYSNNCILKSIDGINWDVVTGSPVASVQHIAYNNNTWVLLGPINSYYSKTNKTVVSNKTGYATAYDINTKQNAPTTSLTQYGLGAAASPTVPIVIGSDAEDVSAAQITVTSAGILNVGGVEMAKKSDALITIKRWDD